MDVMRVPEAGRLWESWGADSYLAGEAVFATVQGVQSVGVQSCAKHLILNSQEAYRYMESSVADEKTLMEKYYVPFQRAIDADVSAIMCSYNMVNGTYSCENPNLIGNSGLVKGFSGFNGYVVSDWGATHSTATTEANAGLDLE
jgi:beta-glucosidase